MLGDALCGAVPLLKNLGAYFFSLLAPLQQMLVIVLVFLKDLKRLVIRQKHDDNAIIERKKRQHRKHQRLGKIDPGNLNSGADVR